MIDGPAADKVRRLPSKSSLENLVVELVQYLAELENQGSNSASLLDDSQASSLLVGTQAIDLRSVSAFESKMEEENFFRVALYDLLEQSGLSNLPDLPDVKNYTSVEREAKAPWLTLLVAAFAWRGQYPARQLDPENQPANSSPAGQALGRAAHFIRKQLALSLTQRDRLARQLRPTVSSQVPTIDEIEDSEMTQPPLPPHYRPPVPERYVETSSEIIRVNPDEPPEPAVQLGDPITISPDEVAEARNDRQAPLTLSTIPNRPAEPSEHAPSPLPRRAVIMPDSEAHPRGGLANGIRQMLRPEELTTTKLKVVVKEHPEGPGMYGLQVRVSCKAVKTLVAGTTDHSGDFYCELPIRKRGGLTYDVEVIWPLDDDLKSEKKSITLNSDRTHFELPFHRRYTSGSHSHGDGS